VVGTLIYQAGRLLLSVVAARTLGPESFGDWVLVSLLVVYLTSVGLGITNGLGRQLPFLAGAGREDKAKRVAEVAAGATIVSGVVAGLLAAALTVPLLGSRSGLATAALVAIAAALQHPFLLQQVLFRSWFAFRRAATQLAVLGLVVATSGIALVTLGINGLLISQIVTYVVAIGLGVRLLPRPVRPGWDLALMRTLSGIGFPIMLAGLIYGFLTTIDRWLAATFLDRISVGYYGLVGLVLSGVLLVPQLLSQQFYPRMAYAYGQGHHPRDLIDLARTQGLLAGAVVGMLAIVTGTAAHIVVPIFLPAYIPSLLPLLIALGGMTAYAFGSGYGNLLNTIGAHRRFLGIQTAALTLNVVLGVGLLAAGGKLEAIAVASSTGMIAYAMMLYRTATKAVALVP
jgi:O-antigen/teichoic acid export membrane protein